MNLQDLMGKKERVKIIGITNNRKYFVAQSVTNSYKIYIENTGDYEIEELINSIEECIIIDIKQNNLIGFILSNRKFLNDIKNINNKLKKTKEYENIKDIYLMERLKIKGKVLGLYLVDEGDIAKYYLETIEIGTFVKKVKENNIIFKDKKIEDEIGKQIRDVIQSIDLNKKEISLREEEEREKYLIEKALGLEVGNKIIRNSNYRLKTKSKGREKTNSANYK